MDIALYYGFRADQCFDARTGLLLIFQEHDFFRWLSGQAHHLAQPGTLFTALEKFHQQVLRAKTCRNIEVATALARLAQIDNLIARLAVHGSWHAATLNVLCSLHRQPQAAVNRSAATLC